MDSGGDENDDDGGDTDSSSGGEVGLNKKKSSKSDSKNNGENNKYFGIRSLQFGKHTRPTITMFRFLRVSWMVPRRVAVGAHKQTGILMQRRQECDIDPKNLVQPVGAWNNTDPGPLT